MQAAAGIGILAVAGLLGYNLGQRDAATRVVEVSPLPRAAAVAHAVYTPEVRHPVEVAAADAGHLVAWLSKRLDRDLKAPDFSAEGYALLGGRLLPGEAGPVAQFMYESPEGRRLTLYVRREDAKDGAKDDTAFRYSVEDGVGVFYWIDHDSGFALSGDLDRAALLSLAHAAYAQMTE
jgi:anti-sigma factor RsiW